MKRAPAWGLLGLGVAIALGMLASSVVVSQALIQIKQENQALEVKGFRREEDQLGLRIVDGLVHDASPPADGRVRTALPTPRRD